MSDGFARRARVAVVATVVAVSACTVGPNYRPPAIATPVSWASMGERCVGEAVTSRPCSRPADVAAWWHQFNDPTLTSLIERASAGNLDLARACAVIRQARAAQAAAASGLFPMADLGLSAVRSGTADATGNFFRGGFDASWEIDVFGGVRRGVEAARADVATARFDRESVLVSLAGEVGAVYLDLRGNQHQLAITRQNLASQQQTLDLTQERLDAGFVSALDVANARAQVATTGSAIPTLQAQIQAGIYALSVLIGREPGALVEELMPDAPFPAVPAEVPVGLPSDLLQRRPDLRSAEAALHAATARVGVAVAGQYPRFSLTGAIGTQGSEVGSLATLADRSWSIGPVMTLPVFTGGLTRANIEQARASACAALIAYKSAVLVALQDVETSLSAFAREQERRARLAEAVVANREAVDLSLQQYGAGKTDFLNVLSAQRQLFLTEAALAQSETEVGRNLVALYKALGGGWSECIP